MNKFILSGLCLLGASLMPFASSAADEFVFTYDYEGAELSAYGIQRNVPIDVAMLVKNQSLVGSKIVGVSVDIPTYLNCTCDPVAYAWLTSKLQVEGEFNVPDIIKTEGEIKNHGTEDNPELRLDITFDQPYTLTEEGVYVGYSVTVTNCKTVSGWTAKYPIMLVNNIDQPQSFMIHDEQADWSLPQRYPQWTDLGANTHQALSMRVIMSGETHDTAASIEFQQTMYAAPSTTGNVYTILTNAGTTPISSIEYTYMAGDREISSEYIVNPPLTGQTGSSVTLDLPFESNPFTGDYAVDVRITKVNGVENGFTGSAKLNEVVVPFLPVNRPLISEYSGLWCGNCPAAYVAIRQLQDKYGEDFLAVSYHSQDQLQSVSTGEFPNSSYGLPKVYLNRDPEALAVDNIEYPWLRARRELAPASLDATLYWENTTRESVIAEAKFRFVYDDPDADYRLAYALIEDDMSDSLWGQRNYYTNDSFEGPYWDLFCGKPYVVTGIVYNDMILSFPNTRGIANSVPKNVQGGTTYTHTGTLSFADAICRQEGTTNGKNLIKNKNKIRVVVLLIDNKTGLVRNAATTGYTADAKVYGTVGVEETASEAVVESVDYYSLDGLRLNTKPEKGGCIILEHLSDGTVRTTKTILK